MRATRLRGLVGSRHRDTRVSARNLARSRCHEVPVNVKPVLKIRYRFVGTTRISNPLAWITQRIKLNGVSTKERRSRTEGSGIVAVRTFRASSRFVGVP